MRQCKITVLKRNFDEELARQYAVPDLGKCPIQQEGQVFYADNHKPEGLCDEAWKAMYQIVFAIAHGSDAYFYDDWVKQPGVAICSCLDGLRPVIYKLEPAEDGQEA